MFIVLFFREWVDGEGIIVGIVVDFYMYFDGMFVIQVFECEDDVLMQFMVIVDGGDGDGGGGDGGDDFVGDGFEQMFWVVYVVGLKQVVVEVDGMFDVVQ